MLHQPVKGVNILSYFTLAISMYESKSMIKLLGFI